MKPEHEKQLEEDSFIILCSVMGTLVIVGTFLWMVKLTGLFEWIFDL